MIETLLFIVVIVATLAVGSAYRNGCRDGFRLAHDPSHPACKRARSAVEADHQLNPLLTAKLEVEDEQAPL